MTNNRNGSNDDTGKNDDASVPTKGTALFKPPASGALTLKALGAVLGNVAASLPARPSGNRLTFSSDAGGLWLHGQKKLEVEAGSRWAINPLSLYRGYVRFDEGTKKVSGEVMASVTAPMPNFESLPEKGDNEWTEQWSADFKCLSGRDEGLDVTFKTTTVGGRSAMRELVRALADRINGGDVGDRVVPVVLLEADSYKHKKHGNTIYDPILNIVGWLSMTHPDPGGGIEDDDLPRVPTSPTHPRRRRVAA